MRFLQRKADVETRYGGRFVNAIEGVRSQTDGGARRDWFYFVNGIEADKGAAERKAARRRPRLVGLPRLERGDARAGGRRLLSRSRSCTARTASASRCASTVRPMRPTQCDAVRDRLERDGVETAITGARHPRRQGHAARWSWASGRDVPGRRGRPHDRGGAGARAACSRARCRGAAGSTSSCSTPRAARVRTLGPGAGLVAATRFEEQQPTWVVTGTDAAGVDRAVALLDARHAARPLRGGGAATPRADCAARAGADGG